MLRFELLVGNRQHRQRCEADEGFHENPEGIASSVLCGVGISSPCASALRAMCAALAAGENPPAAATMMVISGRK
jgi:hypothetical protein